MPWPTAVCGGAQGGWVGEGEGPVGPEAGVSDFTTAEVVEVQALSGHCVVGVSPSLAGFDIQEDS
ncbi:hypothetical protein GCM10009837_67670 [Streptomyces durmitorensis]